jgi:hypothetical protein
VGEQTIGRINAGDAANVDVLATGLETVGRAAHVGSWVTSRRTADGQVNILEGDMKEVAVAGDPTERHDETAVTDVATKRAKFVGSGKGMGRRKAETQKLFNGEDTRGKKVRTLNPGAQTASRKAWICRKRRSSRRLTPACS